MIRVQMIRQDTRHPDKRRRHQGRASFQVAGRRFETQGPAPIYRLATPRSCGSTATAASTSRYTTTTAPPASPAAWP